MDIDVILGIGADHTKKTYATAWHQWRGFNPSLKESSKTALMFLMSLKRNGASMGTIRTRYHALSSIYNRLVHLELAEKNPFHKLASVFPIRDKAQVRPTRSFSARDVHAMLKLPDRRTARGVRDRAIMSAIFGGGLRVSEVHGLDVGDIICGHDGTTWRLHLAETKAQEVQYQPLAHCYAQPIVELVAQRKTEGATETDPLFITARGRLSIEQMRRIFKQYSEEIGQRKAPHAGRATFATQLLQQGATYEQVATALRHNDTQMVGVYDKRRRSDVDNVGVKITY